MWMKPRWQDHDVGQVPALTGHESQWESCPWFSNSVTNPGTAWKSKFQIIFAYIAILSKVLAFTAYTFCSKAWSNRKHRGLCSGEALAGGKAGVFSSQWSPVLLWEPGKASSSRVVTGHAGKVRGGFLQGVRSELKPKGGWMGLAWVEGRAEGERGGCQRGSVCFTNSISVHGSNSLMFVISFDVFPGDHQSPCILIPFFR